MSSCIALKCVFTFIFHIVEQFSSNVINWCKEHFRKYPVITDISRMRKSKKSQEEGNCKKPYLSVLHLLRRQKVFLRDIVYLFLYVIWYLFFCAISCCQTTVSNARFLRDYYENTGGCVRVKRSYLLSCKSGYVL